jgi:transcriptional regulator PpsR
MTRFTAPKKFLDHIDAETASTLISAAADIALIVDQDGVIRDVSIENEDLASDVGDKWLNQAWLQTVTVESRPKIEALLRDAASHAIPRWRQVNHPIERGRPDLPVSYRALPAGNARRFIALGRDLRSVSAMQRRLLDVEQSIERDYAARRFAETRYNLLFQISSEAVIVLDAGSQKVTEANPAAAQLLGTTVKRLIGRGFPEGFDPASTQAINGMLAAVRVAGHAPEIRARRAPSEAELLARATMFRLGTSAYFLVQLEAQERDGDGPILSKARTRVLDVIENSPDGLVITDTEGRIVFANRAFLDLIQIPTEEQARGALLEKWLGRPGADLNALTANLRQHESVRMFATTLRGEYGSTVEVEISAVSVPEGERPCIGFSVRNVDRRLSMERRPASELPRTIMQLTEMVGRVALKDMVRESTDAIERLCIEAALELAGDNRASAAEILGLSRQSLYVKQHRYGLGDLAPADPEDPPNP